MKHPIIIAKKVKLKRYTALFISKLFSILVKHKRENRIKLNREIASIEIYKFI